MKQLELACDHSIFSSGKLFWSQPRVRYCVLVLIVAGSAILRFAGLGRQPLWLDEATDASFAARSFWNCVFAESVHPPLYRALLHFVVLGFGNSAATVRFLPALFGILAIPVTAILARQLFPNAELTGAMLVATSPFLIYYSQENRDYSLLILLALLSTWAFFRFRESGRGLAFYSALSILLIYTHYLAVFVLLAHEIVYWSHSRQRVRDWITARAALVVAFAPWFFWAVEKYQSQSRLFLSPALLIPSALLRFLLGYGIVASDSSRIAESFRSKFVVEAPFLAPAFCFYGWLLWRGGRQTLANREIKTLFTAILLIPCIALLLLAPWTKLAHERYLSFQAPFLLLMVAAGFCSLRGRARLFASVALALVIGFSLTAYYGAPGSAFGYRFRYAKENWAGAAAFVRQEHADAVILAPGYLGLPLDRYPLGEVRESETLVDSSAIPDLHNAQRTALVLSHSGIAQEELRVRMDAAYRRIAQEEFTSQNLIRVIVYNTSPRPEQEGTRIVPLSAQSPRDSR